MGYYAGSHEVDMHFPAHVLEDAHAALVKKCKEHTNNGWSSDIAGTKDLKGALEMLYFDVITNEDGSLTVNYRMDDKVPMNNGAYLAALAPFVHSAPTEDKPAAQGGYIIWRGEDNEYWRDSFEGGKHTSQWAEIQLVFAD